MYWLCMCWKPNYASLHAPDLASRSLHKPMQATETEIRTKHTLTVSACSPVAAWAAAFTAARTVKQLDARGAVVTNTTESRDDCRFHALVTTHSKVHVRCPAEGRRQALTGAAGGGIGIGAPLHSRSPRTEQ
jgi:hypothetical protein